MIRVGKYIYVHWLFVIMAVFCYVNRQLEIFLMSFLIMTIHELSHLLGAKCIGLKCSHITFYPFGLNLKLKNTIIYSLSDEIILYLSGPLSNILMALLVLFIGFKNQYFVDFYFKNIALCLINILPIVPLDGGMVLKKILNYKLGYDGGNKAMRMISLFFFVVVLLLFAILLYYKSFNPSMCVFFVFIIGNVLFSKEKYNTNLLKELLFAGNKGKNKVKYAKVIGVDEKIPMIDVAKKFRPDEKCYVFVTDENDCVKSVMSKEKIIEDLLYAMDKKGLK